MNHVKKIYFVRHGSPERLPGQFIGRLDSPLTAQGRDEAWRTGRWFEKLGFDGPVYSSPLSRAYDTARIITDAIRSSNESYTADIRVLEGLTECDFGLFDGKADSEFKKEYPREYSKWISDPFNNSFPQGESFADCGRRFARAVESVLEDNKDSSADILIAAHMCSVQSYCILAGLRQFGKDFVERPIACASVTEVLYYENGNASLGKWGWIPE